MPKCPDTQHDYFKFDDATIVCRKCGDQRVVDLAALVAKFPQPVYLPCPGPHYPPYQPTWIWQPWITTSGATTTGKDVTIGAWVYADGSDDNATYTGVPT